MVFLKKWLLRLVILIVFVAALLAASDNSDDVTLKFMEWQTPAWPVSWWVLAAFVLGTAFGMLLNTVTNTRLRMNVRSANKQISAREKELDEARASSSAESSS